MLISIEGDIIDTKDIYKVGKIQKDTMKWHDYTKRPYNSDDFKLYDAYFSFDVFLMNRKKLTINHSVPWEINSDFEAYDKIVELSKKYENDITDLRNKLVKYWNKGKSKIPQLELKLKREEDGE
jgi:hypothetical protein